MKLYRSFVIAAIGCAASIISTGGSAQANSACDQIPALETQYRELKQQGGFDDPAMSQIRSQMDTTLRALKEECAGTAGIEPEQNYFDVIGKGGMKNCDQYRGDVQTETMCINAYASYQNYLKNISGGASPSQIDKAYQIHKGAVETTVQYIAQTR